MRVRERLKYRFKRYRVKARQRSRRKLDIEKEQAIAIDSVTNLIKEPDTVILYSVELKAYCLYLERKTITIIVDYEHIEIASDEFQYDVKIYEKLYDDLASTINNRISKKCNKLLKLSRERKRRNLLEITKL